MPKYAPFGEAIYGDTVFGPPPGPPGLPPYEPFGRAIFAKTVFGEPPIPAINVPISITPSGYNALQLNWQPPNGIIGQVLMRSSYGTPTSIYDGVILLDEIQSATPTFPFSASFLDTDLLSGRFYYYALFVLVDI